MERPVTGRAHPAPYCNEDGDWWARCDEAATEEEARKIVEAFSPGEVALVDQQVVQLTEGEYGTDGGKWRWAWHFRDVEARPERVSCG